ncbi:MAG: hypothetical protein KME16_10960 [Scytolyngbya sp. HA4215-MV1]|jgi:hypothetical protein|nr:hypothetical protein [Scytolyngbya sp. HA4215-MV1]
MSQQPKPPAQAQPRFQETISHPPASKDSASPVPSAQAQSRFQETLSTPQTAQSSASAVPLARSQERFQETVSNPQATKGSASAVPRASLDSTGAVSFSEVAGQRVSPRARDYVPSNPGLGSPPPAKAAVAAPQPATSLDRSPVSRSLMKEVAQMPGTEVSQVKESSKVQSTVDTAALPAKTNSAKTNSATTASTTPSETRAPSPLTRWIKSVSPFIWAIVIAIVLIPLAGRFVIAKSFIAPTASIAPHQELTAALPPKLNRLDQEIVNAIQSAHQKTRAYAASELNTWVGELEPRVDNFLDWYFDYFTQKRLEVSAPLVWLKAAAGKFIGLGKASPSAAVNAQLTKTFQKEFTKRVLVPQTAQLRLEVITTAAAEHFVADLSQQMTEVKGKYRIPQGQWERYLDTIATTVSDTEGNLSNLSLKALVGGTGYLAAKPFLLASLGKVGSKISAKFTAKATAKLAAKTGTSVAAELGTSLIDPIVGVGILIWDLWDYQHTVAIDRPLLRSNIDSYLKSMQRSLLDNPETGIMAAINQLEASVAKSMPNH